MCDASSAEVMAKMLRTSSSTTSTLRPARTESPLVGPLDHAALGLGQLGLHAMEEKRRLVE